MVAQLKPSESKFVTIQSQCAMALFTLPLCFRPCLPQRLFMVPAGTPKTIGWHQPSPLFIVFLSRHPGKESTVLNEKHARRLDAFKLYKGAFPSVVW
uniref:Secreted protein n=1 Tax=Steinernema glaseri TaxID=37863 RepID=A0A1I7ZNB0_9BILA